MGFDTLVFPVAIFAVFYFFIIRPQSKKQKEQEKFVNEIKNGQEVVTTSGVFGKIVNIKDDVVTLSLDGKATMKVVRSSISKEFEAK